MLSYQAAEQSPPSPLSDIGVVALSRTASLFQWNLSALIITEPNPVPLYLQDSWICQTARFIEDRHLIVRRQESGRVRMTDGEGRCDCGEVRQLDSGTDRHRDRVESPKMMIWEIETDKGEGEKWAPAAVISPSSPLSSPLALASRKLPFCRKMPSAPNSTGHTKALPRLSCTGTIRQEIII